MPANNRVLKTVYLIRHAQSMENEMIGNFKSSVKGLGSFIPPSFSSVWSTLGLINVPGLIDCNISDAGRHEIKTVGTALAGCHKKGFLAREGVQLVVHSPLRRARMTSFGLTACCTRNLPSTAAESPSPPGGATSFCTTESKGSEYPSDQYDPTSHGARHPSFEGEIVSLPLLLEKTPIEWLPGGGAALDQRIKDFTKWIAKREETVICVTGHSQYFKKMLGMDEKFDNCDVWQIEFEALEGMENGDAGVWRVVDRLFNYKEILGEGEEGKK
jgi:hypothetical protein